MNDRDFVRHCVKLLQDRERYTEKQWDDAMLQLELASGAYPRDGYQFPYSKPKPAYLSYKKCGREKAVGED
jgi:hypothetical protein